MDRKTIMNRVVNYCKKNPYIVSMVVLTLFLILVKYILTGCMVMCMDWYDETPLYLDPMDVDGTRRIV